MKKMGLTGFRDPGIVKKTKRVMRLMVVLILGIIMTAYANSYSQVTKLDIRMNDRTIRDVIEFVEENSEFVFLYKNEDFNVDKRMDLNLKNATIHEILDVVLKGEDVVYDVYERQILIRKADAPNFFSQQQQQQKTVTGVVTDKQGLPLPGVSVVVKGTTLGAVTNTDGNFSLTIPDDAETLQFSFVGMHTQEVPIEGRTTFMVVMEEETIGLEEVVAIGYGTLKKRHLTGSIGSIQMDETLESRPVIDFGQAMYGKIAGVQVLNSSGRPGESSRIQIRGINSISSGSVPLIVVDGVILPDYDLNSINSSDISSIEILKDAASAAIYGSRGANGVILVTTKSGKPGKPSLSVNYSYSSQRVMKKVDVMNGPEYAQAAIDAAQNGWIDRGGDPNAPNTIEARGKYKYMWPEALEHPETLANTDWQDISYRVAPMHQADLSFSGGDDNTKYYISSGIINQEGIVIKSDYEKYTLNMKVDSKVNNWLTIGGLLNISYDTESEPDSYTLTAATQYVPVYPVYAENGLLGGPSTIEGFEKWDGILYRAYHGHPYQGLNEDDLTERLNTAGNLFTEIEFLPNLKFRSSINAFYKRNDHTYYSPVDRNLGVNYRARFYSEMRRTLYYTLENLLVYNKIWNDHQIDAVAGYEFNHRKYYRLFGERRDYDNDLVRYLTAGSTIYNTTDDANEYTLLSVLGRINYNYKGKYMASATFRRDGSSRFGPGNKWGNFPSFSAGWRISEESFIEEIEYLSNLNLRTSYGMTGNDNFGNYRWISSMSQGRAAFGNNLTTTYYPSSIENPDLAWERTRVLNVGLDLGLINNRISFETDFYKSESDGLLLDVPVPSTSGFTSVFQNIGALETKGIELNVNSRNLTGEFSWNSQLTFAANRSTITKLGPDDAPMIITRTNMSIINEIGKIPFSFYAYEYDGVYMNQAEIDADPVEYPFQVHPGHGRYKDINGDGKISSEDRTIIGNGQPDFTWALTNNFRYKNFDFSFLFHGSVGGDVYDAVTRRSLFYHEGRNYLGKLRSRWRSEAEPGDGYHYKLSVDIDGLEKVASSYWLSDGTYTRLKDVTLGYTFAKSITNRLGLEGARVYFNGTNLFSIQTTTAIDPENSTSVTDPATFGIQFSPYPTARSYTFGINVKF